MSLAYLQRRDFARVLVVINQSLVLAEKTNFKRGAGYAHLRKGWYYYETNTQEAEKEWQLSATAFETAHDTMGLIKTYLNLTDLYANKIGNQNGVLDLAYKLLAISEKRNDKGLMADSYHSLGASYGALGNFLEGNKNMEEAIRLYRELKDTLRIAQASMILGLSYASQKNFSQSEELLTYGRTLAKKLGQPEWLLYIAYKWTGGSYEDEANAAESAGDTPVARIKREKALRYYDSAIAYAHDPSFLSELFGNLGWLNRTLQRFSIAKVFFTKGLAAAENSDSKKDIASNMEGLSEIYSFEGDYKKALEYYKRSKNIQDSLSQKEASDNLIQKKIQFDNEKKLAIAKAEQEERDAEAQRDRNFQYFIIALLAVLVLAGLIIAFIQSRNSRQQRQANRRLETAYSELKSAQAQLIQSEKMASLGELTAGIAHEIQNPLNFVNNFSDVNKDLLAEMNDEIDKGNLNEVKAIAKDVIDNEEKINHHGKRADAIVKGMLQHSQKSTGQKEPTDINALCNEYLRLAYHGLRAKEKTFNTEIKTDFDKSIGKINIVPQDIGRAILNLINNSFYAVNEKSKQGVPGYEPTVIVGTRTLQGKIEISVKDNGNGIPGSIKEKIFQPFFTTKPAGQGTGLGLSLSYDIIKVHGGEIMMETKEDEGSVFVILLPIA